MERLKGKYGNNNADIEYWLKRLRSLKPKNKNKVIRKLGQAKEIFTEIEEIELAIANKEKLKYLYNILTDDYNNIFQFDLNSNLNEYLETLKIIILARTYVENWKESKKKMKMVILWTLITLVWRKKTPKLKKKPSNFNIINIDIRRIIKVIDVYVIWADISISNTKKIILKISIIITKEGKTSKKKKITKLFSKLKE